MCSGRSANLTMGTSLNLLGNQTLTPVPATGEEEEQNVGTFNPVTNDEDEESSTPEQEVVDGNGKPIDGLDHIVDTYINMEVRLPQGECELYGKVVGLCLDKDGKMIGDPNSNPFMNTVLYQVQFEDGTSQAYGANILADNMWRSVDDEGYHEDSLHSIIDVKFEENAIKNGFFHDRSGKRRMMKTTRGVNLLVAINAGKDPKGGDRITKEWWISLKEMKQSYPLETAEFAVARRIDNLPAFAWWVKHTLKKRNAIIASIKARLAKTTHKYGVEVPLSWKHAIELDTKNGNHLWRDALKKEMKNVGVAFDILEDHQNVPIGWTKTSGHLIWDVKMDFTRKARWVKDGHKTADPLSSNYAGVVSRDSVRIAFTLAAMNGLDICAADVQNAYIQAPSSEKHYVICGPEFGEHR